MLSQTAQYAVRTVLELARLPAGDPAAAADLAARLGMPRNYLSKILHQLARAGVVASTRGKHGGFVLARPAHRIRLAEVVAPFQDVGERRCLLGRPACSDVRPCLAHGRWKAIAQEVAEFFSRTSVANLLARPGGHLPAERLGISMKKSSRQSHGGLVPTR
jgi:Rrf2 family protein